MPNKAFAWRLYWVALSVLSKFFKLNLDLFSSICCVACSRERAMAAYCWLLARRRMKFVIPRFVSFCRAIVAADWRFILKKVTETREPPATGSIVCVCARKGISGVFAKSRNPNLNKPRHECIASARHCSTSTLSDVRNVFRRPPL